MHSQGTWVVLLDHIYPLAAFPLTTRATTTAPPVSWCLTCGFSAYTVRAGRLGEHFRRCKYRSPGVKSRGAWPRPDRPSPSLRSTPAWSGSSAFPLPDAPVCSCLGVCVVENQPTKLSSGDIVSV